MEQDAQYIVLMESIAEMAARVRMLGEVTARLEAAVERQLELLEALALSPAQHDLHRQAGQNRSEKTGDVLPGNGRANLFTDRDHEYSRETHPALFKVIDLLEQDERVRALSVRQIAEETGISKSWCATAKRYVLREESVH